MLDDSCYAWYDTPVDVNVNVPVGMILFRGQHSNTLTLNMHADQRNFLAPNQSECI